MGAAVMGLFSRKNQEPAIVPSQATEQDVADLTNQAAELSPVEPLMAAPAPSVSPHKAGKPSTFTAKGLQGVQIEPPLLDSELGSSQPTSIRETVPDLLTPFQRTLTYGSMMNDAGVNVSIRVAKMPVLGAEFYVEPHSAEPIDIEIAQFITANLMEGMSAPFLTALDDILYMYVDGYSVMEKVYEMRTWSANAKGANSRQYTMLKKLGVRPASTAKEINYDDNGGPAEFIQSAIRASGQPQDVTLPVQKIIIFTFQKRGGDLSGKSLLRTAYPHWYYKSHFYKIDAVQKERHSIGVPRGKLLPGYNQNDKIIMRTLLRNLRINEEAFVMQTPNIEIDFIKVESQLVDVLASAKEHNAMILLNVLAQFILLGLESSGGGRATAGAGTDLFMKSLKYVANYITDQINMYLIPELVVWNYPTTNFPKLKVRNIGDTRDLQMLGSAIANLVAQGAIQFDDDTENWVRRVFDMPARTSPRQDIQAPAKTTDTNAQNNGSNPKGDVKGGTGFKGKPANAPQ